MLRFYYLIVFSIPLILYYAALATYYSNHEDKYDEVACYKLAKRIIKSLKRRGNIRTVSYGGENVPKEGGYIMYANHQGKFDALGIMAEHEKPCTVIMDAERSRVFFTNQVVRLVKGIRLERHDFKQQVEVLKQLTDEVKNGRRFIYFPEGKYERNGNKLQDFRAGAFKCAKNAKCPIVPVAICDSYVGFDFNSLRRVTAQICFLEPIYFEDYSSMTTQEISVMVKERIEKKIEELEQIRDEKKYNNWYFGKRREA